MAGIMGAWGCGSFENDDAADWMYELESSGVAAVASALEQVSGVAEDEYLEAPEASAAMAAAEIVAAARDGDLSKLSETAREAFVRHRESLVASYLSEPARRALEHIRRQSELKELWEESEEGEICSRGVDSLSLRLREEEPSDKARVRCK
jgi:Domain of unknown function (DUF4259)